MIETIDMHSAFIAVEIYLASPYHFRGYLTFFVQARLGRQSVRNSPRLYDTKGQKEISKALSRQVSC